MAERLGQQFGNYRLVRLIGQGGFSDVYLAEHMHLETQAAIKILSMCLSDDNIEQFRTEAKTVARLIHPHVIRVLDFGVQSNTPYLVMDFAPNGSMRQLHPKGTPLSLATVVAYVKQVAEALQYAHNERLIHRDIKPENMLLGRHGEILLSDFGIALVEQSTRYQHTQAIIGTAAYMAPEQLQGKPRRASDQYALGIVAYEWLIGERPFHGSFTEIYSQQMFTLPPSLRSRVPTIPPDVEQVVLTALAKAPNSRFGSIQAFAKALEQASLSTPPLLASCSGKLPASISSTGKEEETKLNQPPPPPPTPSEQTRGRIVTSPDQIATAPPPLAIRSTPFPQDANSAQTLSSTAITPKMQLQTMPSPPITPVPRHRISQQGGIPASTIRAALMAGLSLLVITGSLSFFAMIRSGSRNIPTPTTQAVATFNADNADPYGKGTLAFFDPLNKPDQWAASSDPAFGSTCRFSDGAYHVSQIKPGSYYVCPTISDYSDFTFEVQMKIIGGDCGGIAFRFNSDAFKLYDFEVCQDGSYKLIKYMDTAGLDSVNLPTPGPNNTAIHMGLNQANLLAVVAQGSKITLYINRQQITSLQDHTYASGEIGILASSYINATEVVYSNARVWTL